MSLSLSSSWYTIAIIVLVRNIQDAHERFSTVVGAINNSYLTLNQNRHSLALERYIWHKNIRQTSFKVRPKLPIMKEQILIIRLTFELAPEVIHALFSHTLSFSNSRFRDLLRSSGEPVLRSDPRTAEYRSAPFLTFCS